MKALASILDLWDRSVALYKKASFGEMDPDWILGRFRRNTRLFLAGDLVLCDLWNGQAERLLVTGKSGRGYSVTRLYQPFQRLRGNEVFPAVVQIVERPESLATYSPDSPDIRPWIASWSARAVADSARGVDGSSPSLYPGDECHGR